MNLTQRRRGAEQETIRNCPLRLAPLREISVCDVIELDADGVGLFVGGDLVLVLQRQADVVQAVEQAVAAEGFDFERQRQAVVVGERAGVADRPSARSRRCLAARWNRSSTCASLSRIGSMPFLKQLL